jgi:hypothetical protein
MLSTAHNLLSASVRHLLSLDHATAYTSLVPSAPGSAEARDVLETLKPDAVLSRPAVDADQVEAMLAGLWLWHDFLDQSHEFSQKIQTPTGSFWHAIMHRREGDFGNSKYWYRQCPNHPALGTLSARAQNLLRDQPVDKTLFKLVASGWDAYAFVDLAQAVHSTPNDQRMAMVVQLQKLEWQSLFDWTLASAIGEKSLLE